MGGMTLTEKVDIGAAMAEASLAIAAASMGCEVCLQRADGWRNKADLGAMAKLLTQAGDALQAAYDAVLPHIGPVGNAEAEDRLSEVLEFYAEPSSYLPRRNKPAPVLVDGGTRARKALVDLQGGDADDEETSED